MKKWLNLGAVIAHQAPAVLPGLATVLPGLVAACRLYEGALCRNFRAFSGSKMALLECIEEVGALWRHEQVAKSFYFRLDGASD